MPIDPAEMLALRHLSRLSIDVEAQLTSKVKSEPLLVVLETMRVNASSSMIALTTVDPENPKDIRKLQNDVLRFTETVELLQRMYIEGKDADMELEQKQRQELAEIVMSDEDAANLGLPPRETHDDN